jgi:hypothetical protein
LLAVQHDAGLFHGEPHTFGEESLPQPSPHTLVPPGFQEYHRKLSSDTMTHPFARREVVQDRSYIESLAEGGLPRLLLLHPHHHYADCPSGPLHERNEHGQNGT